MPPAPPPSCPSDSRSRVISEEGPEPEVHVNAGLGMGSKPEGKARPDLNLIKFSCTLDSA